MIKLEGRTAIVTGSSSGMGEQIARALAAEGMKVMLAARRAQKLEASRNRKITASINPTVAPLCDHCSRRPRAP